MADRKVSELTNLAAPASDDLVYVVHDPSGTPVPRQSTVAQLLGTSVLKDAQVWNVKDHGVLGDNSTDDTSAIQAVITLAAVLGGVVYFPPGTYLIGAAGLVVANNVEFYGCGPASIIKAKASTSASGLFNGVNPQDVHIRDLTIDLNKTNTTNGGSPTAQNGVYFFAGSATGIVRCSIRRVVVKNGHQYGIRVSQATGTTYPIDIDITDCVATTCSIGIYVSGASKAQINDNDASSNTQTGIWFGYSSNVKVLGNTVVSNSQHGICAAPFCTKFTILGNTCDANGTVGTPGNNIVVSEGCTKFTIGLNTCTGSYSSNISIDPRLSSGGVNDIQVTNGVVVGNTCTAAITNHGIYVNYASDLTIVGNSCADNAAGKGIQLAAAKCIVTGNTLKSNAYGLGIQYDGVSTTPMGSHVIGVNRYESNTTARIQQDAGAARSEFSTSSGSAISTLAPSGKWVAAAVISIGGTFAFTDGDCRLHAIDLPPCSIDRFGWERTVVGGSGAKNRIIAYGELVPGAGPVGGPLIYDSGQVAADSGTGAQTVTPTTIVWPGGTLWVAAVNQSSGGSPASLRYIGALASQMVFDSQPTTAFGGACYAVTITGTPAATCPAGGYSQNSPPRVSLRLA